MAAARTIAVAHQYYIGRSPSRVFRAISTPAGLTSWLCDRAELEPKRGGRYLVGWTNGPQHTGTLAAFDPGRRISFHWSWEGVPLHGTRFSLAVARSGRGSVITVEHPGFPRTARWMELYGGAEWGWTYFAMNLKSVLECGRDLRAPSDG